MKFPKIIALLCAISISVLLNGCSSMSPSSGALYSASDVSALGNLPDIMTDAAQEGKIHFAVNPIEAVSVGASAEYSTRTIYFTQPMLNMYKDGRINRNQMMWIIGHEIGHLNKKAAQFRGTSEEEDYCDMYSILLLDEMHDAGDPVDIRDAITYLKIAPGHGDSLHAHPAQRYANLVIQLNQWDRDRGHAPSAN